MAPNSTEQTRITERHLEKKEKISPDDQYLYEKYDDEEEHPELQFSFKQMYYDTLTLDWSQVLWDMVFCIVVYHLICLYGIYVIFTTPANWKSFLFGMFLSYSGGLGITMGTHRMWTHKAFKAVWPVRLVLMLLNTLAFQESIYLWCQNHRVHHKWSDTDRDFTNSRRGFFFAHMGWKMYKTHPEVIKARKLIDVSDLLDDPIVKFQNDYYYYLAIPVCFIFPTVVPYYLWGETLAVSFAGCACVRLAVCLHTTWAINSVAHLYGYKPYDKSLQAYDNSYLGPWAMGEGWHNYHHAFPRDYRASEMNGLGDNFTTSVINFLAKFGLVYDLVTVTEEHINKRTSRTGSPQMRDNVVR